MKKICTLLFCLVFSFDIFSIVINKVFVTGNSKTKKKAIMKWGRIEIGKSITEAELSEIKEKLGRVSQFNLQRVYFENETLFIKVEDKWSLFPVPVVSQSGDYFSRGLLLYENNFLGDLGTLAPGIFWTNSGINGIFYWQQDDVIAKDFGMKVILLHKNDLSQFKRQGVVKKTFDARQDTIIITPNYKHGRHDHKLGPIYFKRKIYEEDQSLSFKSERYGLYYRHRYQNLTKLPVLFDGFTTSYDFFLLSNSDQNSFLQNGDLLYIKPVGDHFFKFETHFSYASSASYLSPKMLGGYDGHRGYSRESLPVRANAGLMLQQQFLISNRFYASAFYEFNHAKLIDPVQNGITLNESTVGFNISYYFKKLSIPAVIIEYARNVDDKSNVLHVNVGLRL